MAYAEAKAVPLAAPCYRPGADSIFIERAHTLWQDCATAWVQVRETFARLSGNDGQNFASTASAVAGGYDRRIDPSTLAGLAFGYSRANIDQANGDRSRIDSYRLGGYAQHWIGPYFFNGYLAAAANQIRISGTSGPVPAYQVDIGAMVGYQMALQRGTVEPYAALQYDWVRQNAFTGLDAGDSLAVGSAAFDAVRYRVGARFVMPWRLADGRVVRIESEAAWAHDFLSAVPVLSAVSANTATFFTGSGAAIGRDAAIIGFGGLIAISPGVDLSLRYSGEFRQNLTTNSLIGKFIFKW
jgi:outer membrane autotransporter protein